MNTLHHAHPDPDPEGRCIFKVDEVIVEDDVLVWSLVVDRGKCQGSHLKHCTPLAQKHLWSLLKLFEALGIEIPKGPFDLKTDELAGLTVGATVNDGKIIDFWSVEDAAATEFINRTERDIDKARADLDDAIERYARARTAESEDIERQRWRARSMAR